jgi:hypothetical protein
VAGHDHHLRVGVVRLDLGEQLDAAHAAHPYVGDHQRVGLGSECLQRFLAARRFRHFKAVGTEDLRHHTSQGFFIVDNE